VFTWSKAERRIVVGGCVKDDLRGLPMRSLVVRFANDHTGATAIEYALIAAGISIVIVAAVNSIGTSLNSTFSSVSSQLK
jgi:pilus assembly protein Flp/PilA